MTIPSQQSVVQPKLKERSTSHSFWPAAVLLIWTRTLVIAPAVDYKIQNRVPAVKVNRVSDATRLAGVELTVTVRNRLRLFFFGTWRRQILENTFDFGEWQVLAPLIERTSSNPNCRRRRIHWTILSSYNAHKRSNETTMTRCRQTMTRELKNLTFQTIQSQPIGVWGCSVSSASEHPAIFKILRFCHVGT